MKNFRKDFFCFIKQFWFIVPLLIAAAIAFGFQVTNFTFGIDSIARDEYLFGERSIAVGRLGLPLLAPLLHFESLFPFAEELFGVIALLCASVSLCVVFKRASGDSLKKPFYTAFACLFVTYPILTEYWVYSMMGWSIALSYLFIALSLLLMLDFFAEKKAWRIILASLLLALTVSIYESLLSVYVLMVFLVLLVKFMFGNESDRRFKSFASNGLLMAFPLVCGILFEFLVSWLLIKLIPDLPPPLGATNGIAYSELGIIGGLANAFSGIYETYIVSSLWYIPILIFVISLLIFLLISILFAIRDKRPSMLILSAGCILSLILLSLIQGSVSPYRCCQVFSVFTAFTFAFLLNLALNMSKHSVLKYAYSCLVILLCFIQGVETNNWFSLNHDRYEAELRILTQVGNDLTSDFDTQKPVVFMGRKLLYNDRLTNNIYLNRDIQIKYLGDSPYMRKKAQTSVGSMMGWAMTAFFLPNTELIKIFSYIGYDLTPCTVEMFNEAIDLCKSMPAYPEEGYIADVGKYIIVRLDIRDLGKIYDTPSDNN